MIRNPYEDDIVISWPELHRDARYLSMLLHEIGRAEYIMALDNDALDCVKECSTYEGVLPALESAHALWGARELARRHPGSRILVGMSGRGDKDMPTLQTTLLTKDGTLS